MAGKKPSLHIYYLCSKIDLYFASVCNLQAIAHNFILGCVQNSLMIKKYEGFD